MPLQRPVIPLDIETARTLARALVEYESPSALNTVTLAKKVAAKFPDLPWRQLISDAWADAGFDAKNIARWWT